MTSNDHSNDVINQHLLSMSISGVSFNFIPFVELPISCFSYNDNEAAWRIKWIIAWSNSSLLCKQDTIHMTKTYKLIIFLNERSSDIFFLFETNNYRAALLVFMVAIVTMHYFEHYKCLWKDNFKFCKLLTLFECKNIEKKTRLFCTPYFLKYLPSISVSEKPMVDFSAVKKIAQKSIRWTFDMFFCITYGFFWYQI